MMMLLLMMSMLLYHSSFRATATAIRVGLVSPCGVVWIVPSKSVPLLPQFDLFLSSSLVNAADDEDVVNYKDQYDLPSTAHSLLHSEINF